LKPVDLRLTVNVMRALHLLCTPDVPVSSRSVNFFSSFPCHAQEVTICALTLYRKGWVAIAPITLFAAIFSILMCSTHSWQRYASWSHATDPPFLDGRTEAVSTVRPTSDQLPAIRHQSTNALRAVTLGSDSAHAALVAFVLVLCKGRKASTTVFPLG